MDRERRACTRSLVALAGAAATAAAAAPRQAGRSPVRGYIVRLDDPPLLAYAGGIDSLVATKPEPGQAFDATSAAARAYAAYLERRQAAVLATIGDVLPLYRYTVATNGFALRLDEAQASRLRRTPGVSAVEPDAPRRTGRPPARR